MKPRIRRVGIATAHVYPIYAVVWQCQGDGVIAIGSSAKVAYNEWWDHCQKRREKDIEAARKHLNLDRPWWRFW